MKKIFAAFLCASLCFLSACTQSEFIGLDSFIERFDKENERAKIEFSSFYVLQDESDEITYNCDFFGGKIMLRLIEENSRITMCRVVMPKMGENSVKLKIDRELSEEFNFVCTRTIVSFTGLTKAQADEILSKLAASKKENEAVFESGSFRYVLFETEPCAVFSVQNRWLKEFQTTLKPESKADFVPETSLRTQTVPHR